jgi:hypothetical protein
LHPALINLLLGAAEIVHETGGEFEREGEFSSPKYLDFKLSPDAERFYKFGPPDRVSPVRYRIGLVMFLLPIVFGWLGPYGAHKITGYEAYRLVIIVIGDLMFVASMFVLGGDFWDKVKALFAHSARVQFNGST